ncbi:uncharacterized protein LOC117640611 isoform X3 [Thrips palmi]|uniref:Uncharacterized protein LOC117640611 isoform X3 n=1 Tax=Thrips palmi TaxID=161013 RepID=A0A6P8ZI74_THRPL|nr:uncharacterized protein LOC117640611 isoform X3 [Thrips palmi]
MSGMGARNTFSSGSIVAAARASEQDVSKLGLLVRHLGRGLTTGPGEPPQRLEGRCRSAAVTMDEPLLLALPDDALLAVLAFLPPRQLLDCRVLCRRLRDLCLHADLWRRVSLTRWRRRCLWRAALRLAPCLRELDLCDTDDLADAAAEVAATACVVAKLSLNVASDRDVAMAATIVEKMSALGGLTGFSLFVNDYYYGTVFDLDPLLAAVNNVSHLTHLEIQNEFESAALLSSCADLEGSPSVKRLSYTSSTEDTLLEALLETHASTLEHLHLDTEHVPVSALKELPKLRSLTCELQPTEDVSGLKALPSLASLDFSWEVSGSPGALELLGEAPHLRKVSVPCSGPKPSAPLVALAASPSARQLESLRILTRSKDVSKHVIAALPKFPSLRDLALIVHSRRLEDFLQAVSPATASSLSMLVLFTAGEVCRHALLHGAAVEGLLGRNPRLHLRVLNSGGCSEEADCEWCRLGCHTDLRAAYAAHCRGEDCPKDCHRWTC